MSDGGIYTSEARPRASDFFQLETTVASEMVNTCGRNSKESRACFGRDSLGKFLSIDCKECEGRVAFNFRTSLDRGGNSLMVVEVPLPMKEYKMVWESLS